MDGTLTDLDRELLLERHRGAMALLREGGHDPIELLTMVVLPDPAVVKAQLASREGQDSPPHRTVAA